MVPSWEMGWKNCPFLMGSGSFEGVSLTWPQATRNCPNLVIAAAQPSIANCIRASCTVKPQLLCYHQDNSELNMLWAFAVCAMCALAVPLAAPIGGCPVLLISIITMTVMEKTDPGLFLNCKNLNAKGNLNPIICLYNSLGYQATSSECPHV